MSAAVLQHLGRQIRGARNGLQWTQAELAEAADLATETVSRLETGKLETVSVAVIARVAAVLGLKLDAMFAGAPVMSAESRPALRKVTSLLAALDDDTLVIVRDGLRAFLRLRSTGGRRQALAAASTTKKATTKKKSPKTRR